jgi:hypothetical protein
LAILARHGIVDKGCYRREGISWLSKARFVDHRASGAYPIAPCPKPGPPSHPGKFERDPLHIAPLMADAASSSISMSPTIVALLNMTTPTLAISLSLNERHGQH